MQKLSHQTYYFDGFTLDLTRGCLFRGTQEIKLRPKPFEALKYLVENPSRLISKAELIQRIWPDTAVTDDSLVQCLMDVRRALGDDAQQIIKTVPRRGYLFDKPVSEGRPTAPVTTYTEETAGVQVIIEEVETNGRAVSETSSLPAASSIGVISADSALERLTAAIKLHRWGAVVGVLTLAVVAVAAILYLTRPGEAIDSVAVMTFVNVNADPNTEYLCEGISDSIINNLSELPGLKVSSLNSVLRYKGKQTDARAVGRELNVRTLLVGRLIQHGDDVSISTELIDAKDNHRLWGQQYNYKLAEIVTWQEKISRDITQQLRLRLSGTGQKQSAKHYTENNEAYQAYLHGRYFNNKRTPDDLKESIRYFNRAVELDPNFALPYAGLASSYSTLGARGTLSPIEAFQKVSAAANRALQIDDTLAEAHFAQALTKRDSWDFRDAEKEFKRAIELNRNYPEAHHAYSHLLVALGRTAESLAESEQLLVIDPLDLALNAHLGWHYLFTRQYDEAIEKCQETLAMGDNFYAHYYLGQAYEQKGRYEEAITELKKAIAKSPASTEAAAALGHTYALSGRRDDAQRVLDDLKESSKQRYVSPVWEALIYAGLGEKNEAFEWLQKAAEERAGWLIYLDVDPRFDSLRSDPRFQDLRRKVGLPQ
jgi:TolB-like protein/DNA-binding winged helix-turn-helix (wHTH) protein/thioredoxin-like negative regulator of GroEL